MSESITTKNLHPTTLELFNPQAVDMREELERVRAQIENKAIDAINWYLNRKTREASYSRLLRGTAIILTALGGLMPVLQGLFETGTFAVFGQIGYVFLALAAACVGFDKFFGFSSGWVRFMTTEMAIQQDLAEFQMDWMLLMAEMGEKQPSSDMIQKTLQRLKEFRLQIMSRISQEMQAWAGEFNSNLLQLERSVQAKTTLQPSTSKIETNSSLNEKKET
jgi:hypothetical protein